MPNDAGGIARCISPVTYRTPTGGPGAGGVSATFTRGAVTAVVGRRAAEVLVCG